MEIYRDYKELFELLNSRNVEYIIVGAYAMAFHGHPRFTGDLDILVHPSPENAHRVILALGDFGFSFPDLTADDFTTPDNVIQLGVPPVRVDLLTSISGVPWDQLDAHKISGTYGEVPVSFISKEDLIQNKKASGRAKDLADLEALGG